MSKKSFHRMLFTVFVFSSSQFLLGGKLPPNVNESAFQTGRSAVLGAMAGVNESIDTKNFSRELSQNVADGVLSGFRGSLDKGGEFDKFVGATGTTMRRNMNGLTAEVMTGFGESADIAGKQAQETFKEGSELDKGAQAGVSLATRHYNRALQGIVHNNAMKLGAIVVGTAAAYFIVKYTVPLAFKMIERALMRPKLIIESSKKTMYQKFTSLFGSSVSITPMVFAPHLEERLHKIVTVTSTINAKIAQGKSNVQYRNLMLYGPPGTGKTMFAMELAKRSGLEYAIMSGSSFAKFKDGEGIEALDELFAWANKSKGLLIFIDEAETFLSKRENMDPQSKAYQLLNNFLNYTGKRSNKFMLVFATNHKEVLDEAMYRRIDDLVEMPLPGRAERIRVLKLYTDKILMDEKQNGKLFVDSVVSVLTSQKIESIADKTKGLSGGDLEGVINSIKTDTDIMEPAVVTHDIVDTVVQQAVEKQLAFTGGKPLGVVED